MNDNILYEALGIDRNSSKQQINQAYLKSIQENQNNPEKMELINVSYQVLTNPKLKQIYDCKGIEGLNEIEDHNNDENLPKSDEIYQQKFEEKTIDNLLYDTLKISRDASLADIQNAYEREYILITSSVDSLMNIDLQKIQLLNAAYNVLTNPEIRKVYDKSGIAGVNQMQEKNLEKEKNQQKYADNVLYEFFGVNRFADDEEIRISYLNLLKNADYNDKEKIKMIHSAYSVLSVPKIRKIYDIEGIEGINKKFTTIHFDEKFLNKNNVSQNSVENENYENLLYETLGIERDASVSQIRFAYQKKLRELHKKYGFIDDESQEVQLIKASFNVLSNPKLRAVYDKSGIAGINQLQSEESNNENSNSNQSINSKSENENLENSKNENCSNSNNNKLNDSNNENHSNSNKNDSSNENHSNSKNSNENDNESNSSSFNSNENENDCDADILYDAIGAKRNASFIEIQMSFLKKLNETVNEDDSDKSQLLHAAYNVLSDPELRKIYDNGGLGAINKVYEERSRMNQEQEQKSTQNDEIFITQSKSEKPILEELDSDTENSEEKDPFHLLDDEDIDTSKSTSSSNDKGGNEGENKTNEEFFENLELNLEQLYNGCTISKTVQVEISCPHCKGTGNEYCEPFPKCPVCNGSGQKIETIEKPADFLTSNSSSSVNLQKKTFSMKRICQKCFGRGELRTDYATCCVCYGLKKFKSEFQVEVQIKPGTSDGEIVKVPLKIDKESTDIKYINFFIVQKKHALFEKLGNDLIYLKKINLTQSLCGILSFPIKTLDNRIIVVKGDENVVIHPNSSFVIKNEGFPIKNDEFNGFGIKKKGDLIVKFSVELPSVFALGPKVVNMLKCIQPLKDQNINYDRSKILKEKLYFYQLPYDDISNI